MNTGNDEFAVRAVPVNLQLCRRASPNALENTDLQ